MSGPPSGAVTFLFTDIEGSTRLVKALRGRYTEVLAEHRRLVRAAIADQGGYEVDTQGDAFFAAFAGAKQAVLCAVEIQRSLAAHEWPDGAPVRVRIGIHTGHAVPAEGAYTGMAVHRAARISAAARGGQVLVSQATQMIIEDEEEDPGFRLVDLGERTLKDLDRPARLFELAAPAQAAPGSGPLWAGCPYLGLVPFDERDARVFYGRGELAGQLAQRLAGRLDGAGILLVAGESGSGKSSLLRAGLMPRLAAGALGPGSERWPRRVIRPAASPLRELATCLAELAGTDPVSVYRSLSAAPEETPMLVDLAIKTATGRGPASRPRAPGDAEAVGPPRLVLLVDQFEELFTAVGEGDVDRAGREAFISALHAAATSPAALVVAAVRADFLGRLIAYPPLKAALDAGPFTVGPMSEAELRLAVTGPAAEAGLAVEPAVIEAVITELRDGAGGGLGSGVLPLMSQAMAATWEYREGSQLTLRGYRRAGGVADAVNRSAQTAYNTLTGPQQEAARQVFTQLTVITPDGQFARRRCSREGLHSGTAQIEDIDAVIDIFSAQRLLVLGDDTVEISHDTLLQAWKQLRDWLGDDQVDRALYSQVVTDAATWDSNRRDSSYLYQPGRLATIDAATTRWQNAPARYLPLPATSRAFLDAAHRVARRTARRRRAGFGVLAMLTAFAVAAAGIAFSQRAAVIQQRDQVLYNQVIADALQFGTTDTPLAAQLTLAAYRIQPSRDLGSRLLNTENTPLPAAVATGAGFVNSVAFSPDGHTLASGDSDGRIQLWNMAQPAQPSLLGRPLTSAPGEGQAGGPDSVDSVAFSPDGRTLASGDSEGIIQLWDVTDPASPRSLGSTLTSNGATVNSVVFSPDGRTLASGDYDGTIQLWDVADPANLRPLGSSLTSAPVDSVAFRPDGRTLASGDYDGSIQLWDVADPANLRPLGPPLTGLGAQVNSVVFSPDGHTLASGDNDGTIRLWEVANSRHPSPLGPAVSGGGAVQSVAFSPDGHTLAGGGLDGTIQLWDIALPGFPSPLGERLTSGSGAVESVAFSPDGHTLATGGLDGVIRLWDLPQTVLTGSAGGLNSVAFNPAGHTLASGGSDGTIRLWDVTDPARPRPLSRILASTAAVNTVAFSPDGHTLASGDSDSTIRLWDITQPARPRLIGPSLTSGSIGVASVTFSSARHLLASGDYDGTIRMWQVADPAEPSPLGLADIAPTSIYSLAFSRDGYTLASGDYGGTVQLWNAADPANLRPLGQPLNGAGAEVNSVAFNPTGSMLASGSFDGTIQLWDVTHPASPRLLGEALTGSSVAVDSVAFSPDGNTLASGSDDGTTRLWNMNVQYAINRICATAGSLTPHQWNKYIPHLRYQPLCAH